MFEQHRYVHNQVWRNANPVKLLLISVFEIASIIGNAVFVWPRWALMHFRHFFQESLMRSFWARIFLSLLTLSSSRWRTCAVCINLKSASTCLALTKLQFYYMIRTSEINQTLIFWQTRKKQFRYSLRWNTEWLQKNVKSQLNASK